MARSEPMHVAIWSDIACPFCNVARERAAWLEREADVTVEWLPYQLHPEYPAEGMARAELMRRIPAGAEDAARRMNEEAGLTYNPHPEMIPNTRRGLELVEWARGQGAHDAMHDSVMDAYWVEGRDITGWDVLEPLVTELGLDAADARAEVDSGAFRAVVEGSTRLAQGHGITAVPAFVLDGRLLISGAQPHEVFQHALREVEVMREKDAAPTN